MPSVFAGLEDALSDAVDATFGELFDFIPMAQVNVNGRPAPDGSRTVQRFTAVIDNRDPGSTSFERLGSTGGGHASKGGPPSFTATNPMLFFETRHLAANTNPRRLDRVKRIDTGEVYEIKAVEQDGQGRLKAGLTKVAQE